MKPNIEAAQKYFNNHFAENGVFSTYSAAYAVTNEDLRHAMQFVSKQRKNALVVTGSGDHPMFTALCDFKHIDTFDISYNAKLIMDIKTSALKILNREEYRNLITDLFNTTDIAAINNMPKIMEKLPKSEQKYIFALRGHRLFCHGLPPSFYKEDPVPTQAEYDKMRKVINQPFGFIWTDLSKLGAKLNKKYDFIHLSNIMQYMDTDVGADAIISLLKHTHVGTIICFQSLFIGIPNKLYYYCQKLAADGGAKWDFKHSKSDSMLYILNRIR